jgi:hypothetical protein
VKGRGSGDRPYTDAFLFGQPKDGNCLSMPWAEGFGRAAKPNLQGCYRMLFEVETVLPEPPGRRHRGPSASCAQGLTGPGTSNAAGSAATDTDALPSALS